MNFPSSSQTNKRERNAPQRLGDTAILDLSDSFEDINFGDSSSDDFVPPKEQMDLPREKVVARIKRVTKKSKTNQTPISRPTVNLDAEFDSIAANEATTGSANAVQGFNDGTAYCIAHTEQSKTGPSIGNLESLPIVFENEADEWTDSRKNIGLFDICQQILMEFRPYSKESLARISILEEAMIKNGSLTMNKTRATENLENSRMFSKLNHLPISNDVDFNELERNLGDEDFRNVAVTHLAQLPIKSAIGNQGKLLKLVIHSIIDRSYLANFNWSGTSRQGERRIAFGKAKNLVESLFVIVTKIDSTYKYEVFMYSLKEKILKHAYE